MPDEEISSNEMTWSLNRSRLFSWLGLILSVTGIICVWIAWPVKPKPAPWTEESTGPGVVRYYGQGLAVAGAGSTNQRIDIILFENAYNAAKVIQPVCNAQLGIHPHMRVEMKFHWAPYRSWHSGRGADAGEECYQIDQVVSLGADAP
jgi:hypothetical protein